MIPLVIAALIALLGSVIVGMITSFGSSKSDAAAEGLSTGCASFVFILIGGLIISALIWGIRAIMSPYPNDVPFLAPLGVVIAVFIGVILAYFINANAIAKNAEREEREQEQARKRALLAQEKKEKEYLTHLYEQLLKTITYTQHYIQGTAYDAHKSMQEQIKKQNTYLHSKKRLETEKIIEEIKELAAQSEGDLYDAYPSHPAWHRLLLTQALVGDDRNQTLDLLMLALNYLPDVPPAPTANAENGDGRNPLYQNLHVSTQIQGKSSAYFLLLNIILARQLQEDLEDGLLCTLYPHLMKLQEYNKMDFVPFDSKENKFIQLFTDTLVKWGKEKTSLDIDLYNQIKRLSKTPYHLLKDISLPPLFEPLVRAKGDTK